MKRAANLAKLQIHLGVFVIGTLNRSAGWRSRDMIPFLVRRIEGCRPAPGICLIEGSGECLIT
jgi:hypothetical protein